VNHSIPKGRRKSITGIFFSFRMWKNDAMKDRPEKDRQRDDREYVRPKDSRTPTRKASSGARTSWGGVAKWYDKHLTGEDTYHAKVLLPNLLRLVAPHKGERILDIACGQGYFTKAFAETGATLTGVDVSEELLAIAKERSPEIAYKKSDAEDLSILEDRSFDKALIVLAMQNIARPERLASEVARVLDDGGVFHIVLNHPAFRIPKRSSWDYDPKRGIEYRRVDAYLSESEEEIAMHPGMTDSPVTISFHRPLQYYVKMLAKQGFVIDRLEEWISHRRSDSGPRKEAENTARKEIPLFLYIRAMKLRR